MCASYLESKLCRRLRRRPPVCPWGNRDPQCRRVLCRTIEFPQRCPRVALFRGILSSLTQGTTPSHCRRLSECSSTCNFKFRITNSIEHLQQRLNTVRFTYLQIATAGIQSMDARIRTIMRNMAQVGQSCFSVMPLLETHAW